jgi:hypothetical protein
VAHGQSRERDAGPVGGVRKRGDEPKLLGELDVSGIAFSNGWYIQKLTTAEPRWSSR